MNANRSFEPFRLQRRTRETDFAVLFEPRREPGDLVKLPNRLLGHFLDHFLKACGMSLKIENMSWPGSWRFDHVLCEDIGQLVGCGVAEIQDQLAVSCGVPGRANTQVCMDESLAECTISFEGRPRIEWIVPSTDSISGLVDAWYDDAGRMIGWSMGTNLQQFFEGFAIGSRSSVSLEIRRAGNLHHVFEAAFRALGDAVGMALGTGSAHARIQGDKSGFADVAEYIVERMEHN